jgi:hypothetical protein
LVAGPEFNDFENKTKKVFDWVFWIRYTLWRGVEKDPLFIVFVVSGLNSAFEPEKSCETPELDAGGFVQTGCGRFDK